MKIILFFYCVLCSFQTIAQTQSNIDTIYWTPSYKLKWEDFQAKPDSNSKFKAVTAASINYTITNDEKSFSYKVSCVFYKKRSWRLSNENILLQHEQGHYDLAELFARKMRLAFKKYKFSNPATVKNDIKKIATTIRAERDRINVLYDKETNFSINKKKQLYWSNKIKAELKALEAYSK